MAVGVPRTVPQCVGPAGLAWKQQIKLVRRFTLSVEQTPFCPLWLGKCDLFSSFLTINASPSYPMLFLAKPLSSVLLPLLESRFQECEDPITRIPPEHRQQQTGVL